jgi:type IV pilus assembly protein PilY1
MTTRTRGSSWNRIIATLGLAALCASPQADTNIAQIPLFLSGSVDPNVMFTFDDSGSMQWEFMPDGDDFTFTLFMFPRPNALYGGSNYANQVPSHREDNLHHYYGRSAHNNKVFYNPDVTYAPWANADGTEMANANPTAALYHPARPWLGSLNLTTQQTQVATWFRGTAFNQGICDPCGGSRSYWPITYYNYIGGNVTNRNSYERVQITSATPADATFTSPSGITRTRDEEIQNFANWFQFQRSRALASFAGIGKAFTQLPDNARVGFGTINKGNTSVDGLSTNTVSNGVRPFTAAERENFYDRLYGAVINNSGTPLRRAAEDVGQYFERSDSRGPWSETPGSNGGQDLACRQSFHVLMTDGFWNGFNPSVGNADGTSGPAITGPEEQSYQYTPSDPFQDGHSNTLGDVGMYFWKRDLRTDIPNEVPINAKDPAFWQHLVTYGIGIGVQGSVNPDTAFDAVAGGNAITWPQPVANAREPNIDDLLHFGLNSRGGFFSADDPDTFATELGAVLLDITERVDTSATSAATSAAVLQADTLLYSASFRSDDWSGTVSALAISQADGSVGSEVWNAENIIAASNKGARNLLTHDGSGGVTLQYSQLSNAQKAAIDRNTDGVADGRGNDRISWLRGNTVSGLRGRSESGDLRLMGDIINGTPQFVGRQNAGYQLLRSEFSPGTYSQFSVDMNDRPNLLLVPTNGGMLHVFNASSGAELFAYVPSEVLLPVPGQSFSPLSQLADPEYEHRYLVDGTPTVSDVLLNGSWATVAVGSMGVGGRTVFALDITDPESMSSGDVLWEFTDPDLGYGVTDVQIVPMENNRFAAVFGNGYNSNSQHAVLFVVDISDGSLIAKIDTGIGSASLPNGLGPALVSDWPDNDLIAHYVYAGDLRGNLWRFDLSVPDPSNWDEALSIFSAVDPSGNPQPITVQPRVALNPQRPGELMVLFGTGSYFRTEDRESVSPQVQTLYGVRDGGTSTRRSLGDRDDMLQQSITFEMQADALGSTRIVREISDNDYSNNNAIGWYLDLVVGGVARGERVISRATFPSSSRRERVRFTTLRPDNDPCSGGREGFIFDVDLANGGRTDDAVFDINQDNLFNVQDLVDGKMINAIGGGFGEELTIIRNRQGSGDFFYDGGGRRIGGGGPEGRAEGDPLGRQSWQQLR